MLGEVWRESVERQNKEQLDHAREHATTLCQKHGVALDGPQTSTRHPSAAFVPIERNLKSSLAHDGNRILHQHLGLSRLQRAIGVLYLPQTERQSHYFFAQLPEQFDALLHIDATRALRPLDPIEPRHDDEVFETNPSGL